MTCQLNPPRIKEKLRFDAGPAKTRAFYYVTEAFRRN